MKPNVGKTAVLYGMLNLIRCGNMGDNSEETAVSAACKPARSHGDVLGLLAYSEALALMIFARVVISASLTQSYGCLLITGK